jgi:hypothetical protein
MWAISLALAAGATLHAHLWNRHCRAGDSAGQWSALPLNLVISWLDGEADAVPEPVD